MPQLVEHGPCNARVVGLIPTGGHYENVCAHYIKQLFSDQLFFADNYQTQDTNAGKLSNTFCFFTKVVRWALTSSVLADRYTGPKIAAPPPQITYRGYDWAHAHFVARNNQPNYGVAQLFCISFCCA